MTEEVGAITGDLELLTSPTENGATEALIRYDGAEEWYRVSGSPLHGAEDEDHHRTHETCLTRLTTPGKIENGNELPTDLQRYLFG